MNDSIVFSVFADLHWREGDWSWCEKRLDDIVARAVREKSEFLIHCGDFCHDVVAARGMIAKYAALPIPAYHVMGNHEFECSSTLEEVLEAFSLPCNWYSFDVRGFRFVALDTNYHHGPDGRIKHYADESVWEKCHQKEMLLQPEQVEFLRDAVATAPGPVCIFSHASAVLPPAAQGIANGREILRMLDAERGGRPVFWINGHYHRNELVVRNGMAFLDLNTTTSEWIDKVHHAYPPELMARCPTSCHSLLNAVPVHAVVRLTMDGDVSIEGMRGAYYLGVTPESLGIDSTDARGIRFGVDVLSARFHIGQG